MPTLGFAPDAEFPNKKGITTFDLVQNEVTEDTDEPDYELLKFESGQRYNMVPDYAKAEVLVKENMTDVIQNFENFYNKINYKAKVQLSGILILTIEGKAVHGMDPSLGVNAGLFLLKFLASLNSK